ncbi:DUF6894 family protein [Sphingomonas glacialis]|uniref:DUF6894 domain-containing protein n=1 Tax=Sphingomonas glacialis TaxID=658225 RepID=A0A502G387_9SPHN|nr:hypothetical protein [Sphingomonas glacialis]TPG56358.1 hypothetical protein EAH76_02010 [Sphingomonas glacialis]
MIQIVDRQEQLLYEPAMPIFHIHIINQHSDCPDPEGHDLIDLEVARRVAIAGVREFLAHEIVKKGMLDLRGRVNIEDDEGVILASFPFDDAINVVGRAAV